jgi:hypothetical protein
LTQEQYDRDAAIERRAYARMRAIEEANPRQAQADCQADHAERPDGSRHVNNGE